MKYVVIRWHCTFPKDEVLARFLRVVHDNPEKIFVLFRLGDDRTGMMIASYRMAIEGWSAEDAMREMHEFGYRGMAPIDLLEVVILRKTFSRARQENFCVQ
jgi:hypothetical protein